MRKNEGPCQGLRVAEFATMVAGPFAAQMLGDLGAEVIKIEPIGGEPMRMARPQRAGLAAGFLNFNRNKKSIAVNLKSEGGAAVARALAACADVVIESNRPGVMDRLGLGYESLSAENPRLIYASITGFGREGPYAGRAAYEHLLQAYSGMMWIQGRKQGAPVGIDNVMIDKSTASSTVNAVLAALLGRERSDRGQLIEISLMATAAAMLLPEQLANYTFLARDAEAVQPPDRFFPIETSDGYVLGYFNQRRQFVGLCRAFAREDLIDDRRYQSDADVAFSLKDIFSEMQATARQFTTAELVAAAAEHDAPLAPINTIADFLDDPQVRFMGIFEEVEDRQAGLVRQIGYPARMHGTPAAIRSLAPRLGADTDALLTSLGHSPDDIRRLRESGAVG